MSTLKTLIRISLFLLFAISTEAQINEPQYPFYSHGGTFTVLENDNPKTYRLAVGAVIIDSTLVDSWYRALVSNEDLETQLTYSDSLVWSLDYEVRIAKQRLDYWKKRAETMEQANAVLDSMNANIWERYTGKVDLLEKADQATESLEADKRKYQRRSKGLTWSIVGGGFLTLVIKYGPVLINLFK